MKLDKKSDQTNKRFVLKGIGMMGACCLIPIIIIAILPLISNSLGMGGTRLVSLLGSLICPIMMIGMMFTMTKGMSCCSKEDKDEIE